MPDVQADLREVYQPDDGEADARDAPGFGEKRVARGGGEILVDEGENRGLGDDFPFRRAEQEKERRERRGDELRRRRQIRGEQQKRPEGYHQRHRAENQRKDYIAALAQILRGVHAPGLRRAAEERPAQDGHPAPAAFGARRVARTARDIFVRYGRERREPRKQRREQNHRRIGYEQNLRQRVADVHKLRDGVDVVYPREREAADDRRGLAPRVIARIVHLRGEDDGHRAAAEPRGDAVDGGAPGHAEERAHDRTRVDCDELHKAEIHHERGKQAEDDSKSHQPRRHAADDKRRLLSKNGGETAKLRHPFRAEPDAQRRRHRKHPGRKPHRAASQVLVKNFVAHNPRGAEKFRRER